MQRGLLMVLIGGAFTLLGLSAMPMKRSNPRQNLIDNPFGWGLFGFGLSSLLVGISSMSKENQTEHEKIQETTVQETEAYPVSRIEVKQEISKPFEH